MAGMAFMAATQVLGAAVIRAAMPVSPTAAAVMRSRRLTWAAAMKVAAMPAAEVMAVVTRAAVTRAVTTNGAYAAGGAQSGRAAPRRALSRLEISAAIRADVLIFAGSIPDI